MVTLCFCWSRLNGSSLISDLSFKSYFLWRELRGLGHVQLMWTARFTDVSPFFRVSGVYYSQVIKTKVVERPCCTAVWLVKTSSCKESGVLESRGCGGTLIPTSLWHCFNCSQLSHDQAAQLSDHLETPAESTFGSSWQSLDKTKTDCKNQG